MLEAEDNPIDTKLARLLHARGRVGLTRLQATLLQVRQARTQSPVSLAGTLVTQGILSAPEAESLLAELGGLSSARYPVLPVRPLGDSALEGSLTGSQSAGLTGWRSGGRVGPFLLGSKLGQGGMGIVYRAHHVRTDRVVALKGLSLEADEELLQRFQRECEAQTAADDHPHVVSVFSSGQAAGYCYIAMEIAEGGDLEERLRKGALPQAEAARLVAQLAHGVNHCHARDITHRDLKPANVLFDAEGVPKLVDFGLARLHAGRSNLTKTGDLLGTPAYMSPEQARGIAEEIDHRCDIYGLGAILYHCLTGEFAFKGATSIEVLTRLLSEAPRPPRELCPELDPALEAICLRAMAKEPGDRYPSAGELALALDEWLATTSPPQQTGGRHGLALGLLAGSVLLALAAGVALHWVSTSRSSGADSTPGPTPPKEASAPSWSPRTGQRLRITRTYEVRTLGELRIAGSQLVLKNSLSLRDVIVGEVKKITDTRVMLELRFEHIRLNYTSLAFEGQAGLAKSQGGRAYKSDTSQPPIGRERFEDAIKAGRLGRNYLDWLIDTCTHACIGPKVLVEFDRRTARVRRVDASRLRVALAAAEVPVYSLVTARGGHKKRLQAQWAITRSMLEEPMFARSLDLLFHVLPQRTNAEGSWPLEGDLVPALTNNIERVSSVMRHTTDALPFSPNLKRPKGGDLPFKGRRVQAERGEDDWTLTWSAKQPMREAKARYRFQDGWVRDMNFEQTSRLRFSSADEGSGMDLDVSAKRHNVVEVKEAE
jgi:serine/threonine protein kinase